MQWGYLGWAVRQHEKPGECRENDSEAGMAMARHQSGNRSSRLRSRPGKDRDDNRRKPMNDPKYTTIFAIAIDFAELIGAAIILAFPIGVALVTMWGSGK